MAFPDNLAQANDWIRKNVQLEDRTTFFTLEFTDEALKFGHTDEVIAAFRNYDEFSSIDKAHDFAWFEVRNRLFTFSINYLTNNYRAFANPLVESCYCVVTIA